MSPRAKLRANIRNNKRAMNDKLNSRWRPLPSRVYYCCQFWSYYLFPVVAGYTLQNFINLTQTAAELLMFVQIIQDGGGRHLGFNFCSVL